MTSYRSLFEEFAQSLGDVLLPLERKSCDPKRMISANAAYLSLARDIAFEIYHRNGCSSMDDTILLYPTLDALGYIREQRRQKNRLDVVEARFLEDLGVIATNYFSNRTEF